MKVIFNAIRVDEIGDYPIEITLNESGIKGNINFWVDGKHYYIETEQFKKAIECVEG